MRISCDAALCAGGSHKKVRGRGAASAGKPGEYLNDLLGFATVHLGWQPESFWRSTPSEFWAAFLVFQKKVQAINASS
ncbi:phage tail assembly chaperone [Leisingera sp. M658]|uniref:phage tail assembly chaperone n=1 Tax=Leisingera sp. M658 TaxID=2867015 RepID=UPI0038FC13ED